jgi:hypothetical protein
MHFSSTPRLLHVSITDLLCLINLLIFGEKHALEAPYYADILRELKILSINVHKILELQMMCNKNGGEIKKNNTKTENVPQSSEA